MTFQKGTEFLMQKPGCLFLSLIKTRKIWDTMGSGTNLSLSIYSINIEMFRDNYFYLGKRGQKFLAVFPEEKKGQKFLADFPEEKKGTKILGAIFPKTDLPTKCKLKFRNINVGQYWENKTGQARG